MPTQTALQCFDSFFLVFSSSDDEVHSVFCRPLEALYYNTDDASDNVHYHCIFSPHDER